MFANTVHKPQRRSGYDATVNFLRRPTGKGVVAEINSGIFFYPAYISGARAI